SARRGEVRAEVQPLDRPHVRPRWQASLEGEMPEAVRPGERLIVEIRATNTGELRWEPPSLDWPRLYLSYHLLDALGRTVAWDGERTPIPRIVDPGGTTTFLALFVAPTRQGRFIARGGLVSEGECWFEDLGSVPLGLEFEVHGAPHPPDGPGWRKRLLGGRSQTSG